MPSEFKVQTFKPDDMLGCVSCRATRPVDGIMLWLNKNTMPHGDPVCFDCAARLALEIKSHLSAFMIERAVAQHEAEKKPPDFSFEGWLWHRNPAGWTAVHYFEAGAKESVCGHLRRTNETREAPTHAARCSHCVDRVTGSTGASSRGADDGAGNEGSGEREPDPSEPAV